MPSVNLTARTFAAVERLAARSGKDVESTVEEAVQRFVTLQEVTEAEYQREWDALIRDMQAKVPADASPGEIEADIDAAVAAVRAERRARRH